MEQQKQSATPREVEMPRPDLYMMVERNLATGELVMVDGVWLWKDPVRICVKRSTFARWKPRKWHNVGECAEGAPKGPKYTGPLTPELLANILIYG